MSLPKPYYQDERARITIYHGDCRDILPHLAPVDLVLTDPPYGIGEAAGKNMSRRNKTRPTDYGYADWDNSPIDQNLFNQIAYGKLSSLSIIFGGNYYTTLPSSCWLVWDKDNTGDFADCELAWTNLPQAVRMKTYRWNGMLQEPGRQKEKRTHPTQKPLELLSWCISQSDRHFKTKKASSILDPFMGSGTTLRAAKDLGRKAIGIEIEEKYCEIAAKRLAQEVLAL